LSGLKREVVKKPLKKGRLRRGAASHRLMVAIGIDLAVMAVRACSVTLIQE
jgi:hypothetical protein